MQLEMHDAAADAIPGDSHGDCSPQEKRHGGTGQRRHRKLKRVLISGFRSAKGLVELKNHILENTTSLKQGEIGWRTPIVVVVCWRTPKVELYARRHFGLL